MPRQSSSWLLFAPLPARKARCAPFVSKVKALAPTFALQRRPRYHLRIMGRIGDIFAKLLDRASYAFTLGRLTILDWLLGPFPETPADRAIREQSERLRDAFPQVEFDDPERHVR
jgi:hypothetical protein